MSKNTHYYDRRKGEIIQRPPRNITKERGRTAGRNARKKHQANGTYPQPDMPRETDRPDQWIAGYKVGYYGVQP
jgi:hypothetical protein